jgi:hypothetical protein
MQKRRLILKVYYGTHPADGENHVADTQLTLIHNRCLPRNTTYILASLPPTAA